MRCIGANNPRDLRGNAFFLNWQDFRQEHGVAPFDFQGDLYTLIIRGCREANQWELIPFLSHYMTPPGGPSQLRTLDLADSQMDANTMQAVLGMAQASARLRGLHLSRNPVGNDMGLIFRIPQLAGSLRNLRQLGLEHIGLNNGNSAALLLNQLSNPGQPNQLTHIHLSYNQGFGECPGDVLANWLRSSPELRFLSMKRCNLGFEHLESIANAFLPMGIDGGNVARVSHIDLGGNERIGQEEGARAPLGSDRMMDVLRRLDGVVSLNLEDCGMDPNIYGMRLQFGDFQQFTQAAPRPAGQGIAVPRLTHIHDANALVPYRGGPNSRGPSGILFSPAANLARLTQPRTGPIVEEPDEREDRRPGAVPRRVDGFSGDRTGGDEEEDGPYVAAPTPRGSNGVNLSGSRWLVRAAWRDAEAEQLHQGFEVHGDQGRGRG